MKSVVADLLEYWHAGWRYESMPELLAIASYSHRAAALANGRTDAFLAKHLN